MIRNLTKQGFAFAMLAVLAACGGGDQAAEEETTAGPVQTTEAPAGPAEPAAAPSVPGTTGTTHTVQMISLDGGASGKFEPAQLTVKQGDVVRFVQADAQSAHNVRFPQDKNAGKSGLPTDSPLLTQTGQTYDLAVTMGAGDYNYECLPHAAMGMVGKLTVQ